MSELFSAYNTALDADRSVLPVGRLALMVAQTDLEYEQTRVKNPAIGRDLNPMGRGDGAYYPDDGGSICPMPCRTRRARALQEEETWLISAWRVKQ